MYVVYDEYVLKFWFEIDVYKAILRLVERRIVAFAFWMKHPVNNAIVRSKNHTKINTNCMQVKIEKFFMKLESCVCYLTVIPYIEENAWHLDWLKVFLVIVFNFLATPELWPISDSVTVIKQLCQLITFQIATCLPLLQRL